MLLFLKIYIIFIKYIISSRLKLCWIHWSLYYRSLKYFLWIVRNSEKEKIWNIFLDKWGKGEFETTYLYRTLSTSSNYASWLQIWWHLDCRTQLITSLFVVNMTQLTSHPKTPCTWNWAREDPMRFHTQLHSTLKGVFILVFSINYSMCHPGQLAAVNWIWQVNLRTLFTDCTRDLG